jgi:hypothetical protein
MAGLSSDVIVEFCKLCSWTHEVWQFHRALFDDNPLMGTPVLRPHAYTLSRLSTITQEYSLHQLTKLHDPAIQGKSINLSINYVIEYGAWDATTLAALRDFKAQLDSLEELIRTARNKILAHNDLATILAKADVGGFPANADVNYFSALQQFADIVHDKVVGGPYPFSEFSHRDAEQLMSALASAKAVEA